MHVPSHVAYKALQEKNQGVDDDGAQHGAVGNACQVPKRTPFAIKSQRICYITACKPAPQSTRAKQLAKRVDELQQKTACHEHRRIPLAGMNKMIREDTLDIFEGDMEVLR